MNAVLTWTGRRVPPASIRDEWARSRGVHYHVSPDNLGRYVVVFAFRLNEGNCKRHTLDRLDSMTAGTAGKRLTYKALIQ